MWRMRGSPPSTEEAEPTVRFAASTAPPAIIESTARRPTVVIGRQVSISVFASPRFLGPDFGAGTVAEAMTRENGHGPAVRLATTPSTGAWHGECSTGTQRRLLM